MPLAVATRYAKALAELAERPAVDEIRAFEAAVAGATDLRNVLLSPAVPPARKRAVVARLSEKLGISRVVRNFLYVVIDHRRLRVLSEIRESFEALLDERTGVVRADVASARELSEPQQQALGARLSSLTGKQVRMEFSVDENLLGGVRARIGSTIYDGSVRGRLEELRKWLVV